MFIGILYRCVSLFLVLFQMGSVVLAMMIRLSLNLLNMGDLRNRHGVLCSLHIGMLVQRKGSHLGLCLSPVG